MGENWRESVRHAKSWQRLQVPPPFLSPVSSPRFWLLSFFLFFFLCSHLLNSADLTISEPGTVLIYDLFHIHYFATFISFTGTWTHNWLAPNISDFIERNVTGSNPVEVLNFLSGFLRNSINRRYSRWRHFTTATKILQGFAFLCKLGLSLFKPLWDYKF